MVKKSIRELKRLKEYVQQGPPDVIIGKAGVTENVLKEIERHLDQKGIIKIKMLKTTLKTEGKDRFTIAKEIAEKLNALLLEVRGRTLVLYREPKKKSKTLKNQNRTV